LKQEIEATINEILRQFVFEPNTYPTWLAIQYLVDEYLFSQQKAGNLQSVATEESYTVQIGLNNTMTALDILNDYMVLSVMLKLKNQEDFLVLTFKNQMVQA
jgi:phage tail sheath protein FI